MAATGLKARILKFLQISLNKIEYYMKCFDARSVTYNIQDEQCKNHASVDKDEKWGTLYCWVISYQPWGVT